MPTGAASGRAFRAEFPKGRAFPEGALLIARCYPFPMEVQVLQPHGFCGGVRRAIALARAALREEGTLYILGPLVHNREAREALRKEGALFLDPEEKDLRGAVLSLPEGTRVLFGAHGHDPSLEDLARRKGARILDATCPFVRKNAERIRLALKEGRKVCYLGEEGHAECRAVLSEFPGLPLFGRDRVPEGGPLLLVSQTTMGLGEVEEAVRSLSRSHSPIEVLHPCKATEERQRALLRIEEDVEALVVLGGAESRNTVALRKRAESLFPALPIFLAEGKEALLSLPLGGYRKIALTSGASYPEEPFLEAERYLRSL